MVPDAVPAGQGREACCALPSSIGTFRAVRGHTATTTQP